MRWDRSYRSPNIEDRRASSGLGGGGFPLWALVAGASRFGWRGILVALVLVGAMVMAGRCSDGTDQRAVSPPEQESSQKDELAGFVGFVLDDVQKTWQTELGNEYEPTHLVLFRDSIGSACGSASAAVGPFYCPIDHKVYIDLAFYNELHRRFGAPGDFAQAYVIAHEVGHHIQNLRGKLGRGEVHQIEIELQADCLAGAWGRSADQRGLLETGDVEEALNAAAQIGDDTIQRKTQGRVQPETWTHGSSQQRVSAFRKGLQGGAEACGI